MSIVKAAKAIVFSTQAHESHTTIKVKNVLRWLKSGHEVRVQISGNTDRNKAMESILRQLQRETKSGANFMQKVVKPGSIRVVLIPTEEAANIQIDNKKVVVSAEEEIENITSDKDVFSEEFEKDLLKSIREDRIKNKKN